MEPVVRTTAGRVRGIVDDGALAFLGMPYAAPPVGVHRLLAPARPVPWDGIREARAYGPTAQQPEDEITGGIPEPSIPGDDILTVNVFTPDLGGAGLPVLVWIHGGGFVAGSPASPWYRGTRFAGDGVVVVTIGYRLGAEGFLALDGAPANRAVLDWLAALEWVHENIAAFGGDPDQVTVAGQSAGAAACTTLLSMPRAAGLFRRVISMSGVAHAASWPQAEQIAAAIAGHLGVVATRDAVAALPASRLRDAQRAIQRDDVPQADRDLVTSGRLPFAPIVDGELVPEKPLKTIARGQGAGCAVMAGATHDEVSFSARNRVGAFDEHDLQRALARLGLPAETYRSHHAKLTPRAALGQAVTDQMFRGRVQRLAEARAADASSGSTFLYEFRWRSSLAAGRLGAAHCIDIPFAFDNLDAEDVSALTGPEPPQALAEVVHSAWVRFVAEGDPGWPAHDLDRRQMMLFDVESRPAEDPLGPERALWAASRT